MAKCPGNAGEHCCWVNGSVCIFLEENTVAGRHWACGLRRELGSWTAVHSDPRYTEHIRPHWDKSGTSDCGDFPLPHEPCVLCGANT